jgi:hypothetical protein
MCSEVLRAYDYFSAGTCPTGKERKVVAMRGAGRFAKLFWAGKAFAKNLIWVLVAYAPFAVILTVVAGVPLREVLLSGGVFVAVWAAVATVVMVRDGWPSDEARARTAAGRWWEGGGGG